LVFLCFFYHVISTFVGCHGVAIHLGCNPPTPLAAGGARQRRNYQQQGTRSHYKQQGQEARNKKQEARSNYKQQAARSKKQEARKQQVEEENEEDEEEEEMKAAIWTGASFLPAARCKK
jgi:hypothetical protein